MAPESTPKFILNYSEVQIPKKITFVPIAVSHNRIYPAIIEVYDPNTVPVFILMMSHVHQGIHDGCQERQCAKK